MSLLIYDEEAAPRQLKCHIVNGSFSFSGLVAGPVFAELSHPQLDHSVAFFLDNSELTVTLNSNHADAARVTGSRANSLFRYSVEMCQGDDRQDCLFQLVCNNDSAFFAPYLILSQLTSLDYSHLRQLFDTLRGPATRAYHYPLLARKVALMGATIEGQRLPDFVFPDSVGKKVHFDSLLSDSTYLILSFGASWCDQCRNANRNIQQLIGNNHIRLVPILIDKDKRQWDNPMLQQLSVDYIPFLIVVDPQGRILARDVRVWELPRMHTLFNP